MTRRGPAHGPGVQALMAGVFDHPLGDRKSAGLARLQDAQQSVAFLT
jgi:hypothetical protein